MRSRNRREIRRLAREAMQRARGGAPSPPPAAPPPNSLPPPGPTPVSVQEMMCVCGEVLRIPLMLHRRRCSCPSCRRKFLVSFTTDRGTGMEILSPVYLDDGAVTGDTRVAEAMAPLPPRTETVVEDPEPPGTLPFLCPCGTALRAVRADYDKRAQCGKCGARLLLALVYDSNLKAFRIEVLRLTDAPSGETHFLER